MAAEFQTHVDDMMRDADLKEVRDQINELRNFDLKGEIERTVDADHSLRDTFASNPLEPGNTPPATTPADAAPAATEAGVAAEPAAAVPGADAPAFIPPEVAAQFEPQPAFIPPGTTAPGSYYSGFRA
jgi:sec-independent protein translocase protein TatB